MKCKVFHSKNNGLAHNSPFARLPPHSAQDMDLMPETLVGLMPETLVGPMPATLLGLMSAALAGSMPGTLAMPTLEMSGGLMPTTLVGPIPETLVRRLYYAYMSPETPENNLTSP